MTQHVGSHTLVVYASEFIPEPGDVTSYKWKDKSGRRHELPMPNFCLTNFDQVFQHCCQYIASAKWSYLSSFKNEDELVWMTVSMAVQYAQRNKVSGTLASFLPVCLHLS